MNFDIHDFKHEARLCYEHASTLAPDDFRWPYFTGIILTEMGDPDGMTWFERAATIDGDYLPLQILIGRRAHEMGDRNRAHRAFLKAKAVDPSSAHALFGLARVALAEGTVEGAYDLLVRAVELDSLHGEAHSLLAEVLRRLGKPEAALAEMRTARQLPEITPLEDPVYEEVIGEGVSALWFRERGRGYEAKGDLARAVREYQGALRYKPDASGHDYVGQLLARLDRPQEAMIHYQQAITLNPRYIPAYLRLAEALARQGKVDEGTSLAERAVQMEPSYPESYLVLSDIQTDEKAAATLRRGLRATNAHPHLALRLSWILSTAPSDAVRDGEEAHRLARRAMRRVGESAEGLAILAAAFAEIGDFENAVRFARQAVADATEQQNFSLAREIEVGLAQYVRGQPVREERPAVGER